VVKLAHLGKLRASPDQTVCAEQLRLDQESKSIQSQSKKR